MIPALRWCTRHITGPASTWVVSPARCGLSRTGCFPAFGTTIDPKAAGYLLGGQAGYNYQMGQWVVGLEADIGGSNAEGGKSCPNAFFFTCHAEVDTLASLTARLGYSWERTLFYVKGGLAIGEVTAGTSFNAIREQRLSQ